MDDKSSRVSPSPRPTRLHRHHSLLFSRRTSIATTPSDTMEYLGDDSSHLEGELCVFPIRVFLETLQIGPKKYLSSNFGDIELSYESGYSDLILKVQTRDSNNSDDNVSVTYCVKGISASNLSLHSSVPGSLESMVSKLILETDKKISYLPYVLKSESEGSIISRDKNQPQPEDYKDLDIGIITMTTSVHETGHLRDMLFLKCNYQDGVNPDLLLGYEKLHSSEEDIGTDKEKEKDDKQKDGFSKHHLSFMEGVPYWVKYIPWLFYSRRTRRSLERIILLYSIFSVLWATWQLYRHVNLIHVVIQPIIMTLRYYFSSVVEFFDLIFANFTVWWHTFLSPLNVLCGLLLAPMWQACIQLKNILSPLCIPAYQLLMDTRVVSGLASLSSSLVIVMQSLGSVLWMFCQIVLKPVVWIWQSILNSRLAVASIDIQRTWVFNLIVNSIRSIAKGLANFAGYRRKEKMKEAIQTSSGPVLSPISSPSTLRRRSEAILYSSPPPTKQN